MARKLKSSFSSFFQRKWTPVAFGAFLLGVGIFVLPSLSGDSTGVLPETGAESNLVVSVSADKSDVQRDDPGEGAGKINYEVTVSNTSDCTDEASDIVFVFDKSGSMGTVLSESKKVIRSLIKYIDTSKDRIGLVGFNDFATLDVALSSNPDTVNDKVNSYGASGLSDLGAAIEIARRELVGTGGTSHKVIVVISDGRTDFPRSLDSKENAISFAQSAKASGIKVVAVALGEHADTSLLKDISSSGAANFFEKPSESDIIAMYSSISRDLQSTSYDTVVAAMIGYEQAKVLDISSDGEVSQNSIYWKIEALQCQESRLMTFDLELTNEANDLDTIEVIAGARNAVDEVAAKKSIVTTVHAPVFALTNSTQSDTILPGDLVEYDIGVRNLGTGNAYNANLEYDVSEYIKIKGITTEGQFQFNDSVSSYLSERTFNLSGSFDPNSDVFFLSHTLEGQVVDDINYGIYPVTNTLRVKTESGYMQEDIYEKEILFGTDLSVIESSSPAQVIFPTAEVHYSIDIENTGTVDAEYVQVIADFDEPYIDIVKAENAVNDGSQLIWDFDLLRVNEKKTINYVGKVRETYGVSEQVVNSSSTIYSSVFDLNIDNNTFFGELEIVNYPLLVSSIEMKDLAIASGDNAQLEIKLRNATNLEAQDITLVITKPEAFLYANDPVSDQEIEFLVNKDTLTIKAEKVLPGESLNVDMTLSSPTALEEGNYIASLESKWYDNFGVVYTGDKHDSVISVIDSSDYVNEDLVIVQDGSSLIEDMAGQLGEFFALPDTGMPTNYLKLFLGVTLIIPLPVVFIWEISKSFTKRKMKK